MGWFKDLFGFSSSDLFSQPTELFPGAEKLTLGNTNYYVRPDGTLTRDIGGVMYDFTGDDAAYNAQKVRDLVSSGYNTIRYDTAEKQFISPQSGKMDTMVMPHDLGFGSNREIWGGSDPSTGLSYYYIPKDQDFFNTDNLYLRDDGTYGTFYQDPFNSDTPNAEWDKLKSSSLEDLLKANNLFFADDAYKGTKAFNLNDLKATVDESLKSIKDSPFAGFSQGDEGLIERATQDDYYKALTVPTYAKDSKGNLVQVGTSFANPGSFSQGERSRNINSFTNSYTGEAVTPTNLGNGFLFAPTSSLGYRSSMHEDDDGGLFDGGFGDLLVLGAAIYTGGAALGAWGGTAAAGTAGAAAAGTAAAGAAAAGTAGAIGSGALTGAAIGGGMALVTGGDPLQGALRGAVGGAIGATPIMQSASSAVSGAVGATSSAATTAIHAGLTSAATSGLVTAANGGSFEDVLKNSAVSGIAGGVGSYVTNSVKDVINKPIGPETGATVPNTDSSVAVSKPVDMSTPELIESVDGAPFDRYPSGDAGGTFSDLVINQPETTTTLPTTTGLTENSTVPGYLNTVAKGAGGAAAGGTQALLTGGDIGKGIITGGLAGAAGGFASDLGASDAVSSAVTGVAGGIVSDALRDDPPIPEVSTAARSLMDVGIDYGSSNPVFQNKRDYAWGTRLNGGRAK